jgi:hypothetical protein
MTDLLRDHGSPGGVAIALRALEHAQSVLGGEPGAFRVRTAFAGPGARDAFQLLAGGYAVDPSLRRPELGPARERFVFEISDRTHTTTLVIRDGFVTDEFAALAFAAERTDAEQARLEVLKRELAERVMAAPAGRIFDAGQLQH